MSEIKTITITLSPDPNSKAYTFEWVLKMISELLFKGGFTYNIETKEIKE